MVKKFKIIDYPKGFSERNSFDFVEKMKNMKLENNETIVSFDVVGLFPNIPLDVAFKTIDEFLELKDLQQQEKTIPMSLSRICMNQNQFKYMDYFKNYVDKTEPWFLRF